MMEIKALINHKNPETRKIWRRGVSNELGRLMNGINGSAGTNTMHPILKHKMPKDKRACFSRWVADIRLQKDKIHRVQMTAAGNFVEQTYANATSTETANIEIVKVHTNHIISSIGAKCCALDICYM